MNSYYQRADANRNYNNFVESLKSEADSENRLVGKEVVEGIPYSNEGHSVKRQVEGKLAVDVRKRFNVAEDAPVFLTEKSSVVDLSELTAETVYDMIIECDGQTKTFDEQSASENFAALLAWLDGAI